MKVYFPIEITPLNDKECDKTCKQMKMKGLHADCKLTGGFLAQGSYNNGVGDLR